MHTREARIARQVEVAVEQILDRYVKGTKAALGCLGLRALAYDGTDQLTGGPMVERLPSKRSVHLLH